MLGVEANINFGRGGTPMRYVGINYHKKYNYVTVLNEMVQVVYSQRLDNQALGLGSGNGNKVLPRYRTSLMTESLGSFRNGSDFLNWCRGHVSASDDVLS
jgi:hypothetical protein